MNFVADIDVPLSKRCSTPRPSADGNEVKEYYDRPHSSEHYKNWKMESKSRASCGENSDTSVKYLDQIERPCPSPPNPYKWAESLQCLLEDYEGIKLFENFSNREDQHKKCLYFLLACRGVKKQHTSNREASYKLYKAIFRSSRKLSAISDETREVIKHKLCSNTGVDNTIFDAAHREIESYITKTIYPNFLRSDLYFQHLRKLQDGNSLKKEHSLTSEAGECRKTVHEDAELEISCDKIPPLTRSNAMLRHNRRPPSNLSEGPGRILQSPYNYHAKYNPCPPASTRVSELQSLSSDAQSDDAMPLRDSNIDMSMSSKQQKCSGKASTRVIPQKETSLTSSKEEALKNRSQRFDHSQILNPMSSEFSELVFKKLNTVIKQKLNKLEEEDRKRDSQCVEEESDQLILDQHIAKNREVFGESPPKPSHYSGPSSSDRATVHKHSQASQFTVPTSIKCRRDYRSQSPDSALYDSSCYEEPVDYSRPSKHSSKRLTSFKRNSFLTGSKASFDSGIGLSCESIPTHMNSSSHKSLGQKSGSQGILDENRTQIKSRKPNRIPCSLRQIEEATANTVSNGSTVIAYKYGHGPESVPYVSRMPAKNITLQQFKTVLAKKGNFRYFFKTASNEYDTGAVFEEVNEDHKILPLWLGKVFCVIDVME